MTESTQSFRERLRQQIAMIPPVDLLPHHRRGALLILSPSVDLLDVAEAIADDRKSAVEAWIEQGALFKPSLAQLADFCVDAELRFQFVILQPWVLAQPILAPGVALPQ